MWKLDFSFYLIYMSSIDLDYICGNRFHPGKQILVCSFEMLACGGSVIILKFILQSSCFQIGYCFCILHLSCLAFVSQKHQAPVVLFT